MAQFTVRVELHGAEQAHYDLLHQQMEANAFHRYIRGVDASGAAGVWALPTAEYDHDSSSDVTQIRDLVKIIADSIKPGAWVSVTQVAARSWITTKVSSS